MTAMANPPMDRDIDLGALAAALGRRWPMLLGLAVLAGVLAFLLAMVLPDWYRGETRLLIETRESVFTREGEILSADLQFDEAAVESQVAIITSTQVLAEAAERLQLRSLPDFADLTTADLIDEMKERLEVYRVENSRVVVVEFSSRDAELAARGANVIAETYIELQESAKAQSTNNATDYLQPEIRVLEERVAEAESRVADYRTENDIPSVNEEGALASQQLAELSSELSRARAELSEAEARAQSVREALAQGGTPDAIPEVASAELVSRLQERRVDLAADLADLSGTLLGNHPRIKRLRSQLQQLDGEIRAESANVLESLEGEARTARLRRDELAAELDRVKAEVSRVGEKEVGLRTLQRDATTQRELLESYLGRFRAAQSRQTANYQPADARIFSRAIEASEPYFPKVGPFVAVAFAGTLLLSIVGVMMAELFSGSAMAPSVRSVKRRDETRPVEREAPVATHTAPSLSPTAVHLASLGAISSKLRSRLRPRSNDVAAAVVDDSEPDVAVSHRVDDLARHLLEATSERSVFVSTNPESASSLCVRTIRGLADLGVRAVLVDLTEANAAAAAMLDGQAALGIADILTDEASLSDAIHLDVYSDASVLPLGQADLDRAMERMGELPQMLEKLDRTFDLVLIDAGSTDAEALDLLGDLETLVVVAMNGGDETADVHDHVTRLDRAGYRNLILASDRDQDASDDAPSDAVAETRSEMEDA